MSGKGRDKIVKKGRAGLQLPKSRISKDKKARAGLPGTRKSNQYKEAIDEGISDYKDEYDDDDDSEDKDEDDYEDDDYEDDSVPSTTVNLDLLMGVYGNSNPTVDIESFISSNLGSIVIPEGMVLRTISEQISSLSPAHQLELMAELLPHTKVVNFVDQLHDFIKFYDEINNFVFNMNSEYDKAASAYAREAIGLTGKINVLKSHIVQQKAFDRMYETLARHGIIVPPIGPPRFVKSIVKSKKPAYQESGRKGDGGDSDEGGDMDEEGGDTDGVVIQPKTVYAVVDGATHKGVTTQEIYTHITASPPVYLIDKTNPRRTLTILLFGDLVQAVINPYDGAGKQDNTDTDTSVTMTLTMIPTGHFIKIRLIGPNRKSQGISVNSVLNVFGLKASFPDAMRGKGDALATFRIESASSGIASDVVNFLGLCGKTTCDQVLFSETDYGATGPVLASSGFVNQIDKVLTVDLYVHAGIRANYLLGRISELPAVYEMTKGGWMERPGISNMQDEIKSRFVRALNLAVYLKVITIDEAGSYYDTSIVDNYASMQSNFYTSVKISHKIVKELTIADNIFTFMTSLLAMYQANATIARIGSLITELSRYLGKPTDVSALFKIPFFESILTLPALDAALRNQQTLITTSNKSIQFKLTQAEEEDMTAYEDRRIKAVTKGVIIPTNIMRDVCKERTRIPGYDLDTYASEYYGTDLEGFCSMLMTIDALSAKAFKNVDGAFDIFGHLRLGTVTSTVNVETNTVILESLSGNVSSQLETYYGGLNEGDEEGEGTLYKYKSGQLVGPLQYEVLWILSAAILKAPFKSTRGRSISKENDARKIIVMQHAKYLYGYFDAIGLGECLSVLGIDRGEAWFVDAYYSSILAGINQYQYSYRDFLHIPTIQFPLQPTIPDIDKEVEDMRMIHNESLPGKNRMGGKKRNNKNTRRIKKNIQRDGGKGKNKRKTVKRKR